MWDEAARLTEWLGDVPMEAQLLKLAEEVGEVAEAYLGLTGLNRRKGVSHTRDDLMGEVADVIITASVTLVRLAGGPEAARHVRRAPGRRARPRWPRRRAAGAGEHGADAVGQLAPATERSG